MLSYRRPSAKIALFERSEFAILEGRDLESINFWNEIFGQELFDFSKIKCNKVSIQLTFLVFPILSFKIFNILVTIKKIF